jgi:hypothetical protein
MVKIVDLQHKWAVEIGRVFIAFGSIEHVTHTALRELPRDPLYSATNKLQLGPRIDLLLAILNSREGQAWEQLTSLLQTAKELSDGRNLIAHNPLGLDVYVDEQGEPALAESIRSLRKHEKHMSFAELVALRESSEALATKLFTALSAALESR